MLAIEMPPDEDAQASTRAASRLLADLERDAIGGDDIVAADHPLVLDAEDLVEIEATERHEGGAGVEGQPTELGVEGGQEASA